MFGRSRLRLSGGGAESYLKNENIVGFCLFLQRRPINVLSFFWVMYAMRSLPMFF